VPAEDLARAARMDLADSALHAPAAEFGGVEFYPDLARKTAVLAARLIRNHPLPDGNKLWATCAHWSSWPATVERGPIRPTTLRVTRPLPSSSEWPPARSTRMTCATGSAAGWRDHQSVPVDPRGKRDSPSRPGKDRPLQHGIDSLAFRRYALGRRRVDSRPASCAANVDCRRSRVASGSPCSRHVRAMSRSCTFPPRFRDRPVRRISA
jgi:hypothetical protein